VKMNIATNAKGMYLRAVIFALFSLISITRTTDIFAAPRYRSEGEVCGMACGSFIFIIIAIFVLNIALLVWVAKDSKNRGMGSSVGWIFLILFTGIIGLIIYLFSRPSGELVYCEVCKNKRLKVANVCPHCGNPSKSTEARPTSAGRAEYCKNCGHKVTPDSIFCEECGNRIER